VLELNALGRDPNVNIRIEDLAKVFSQHLSPRLLDLLEIAAYVYTADCATDRGEDWTDNHSTEPWERDFRFVIPVRDLSFWERIEIQSLLSQFLQFLSDDKYSFKFCALDADRPSQTYLEFGTDEDWPFHGVDRVLMFSGGLDSLAGAIETASAGENLVLVTHRPMAVLAKRVGDLFSKLRRKYPVKMIHIPVWVNKQKGLDHEDTQRTRSFLFSALGTIVAESVRARGVRFFENGVVSLNLPIADEVLRARASRTTHPLALYLLTEFYRLILERDFEIDNPYVFKTKADIVSIIAKNGGNDLISSTCSCARPGLFKSKTQWHCGTCSQCIDRRIAIIAAGQAEYDLDTDYKSDVFVGARTEGYEKNMAVNYLRHGLELYRMSDEEMAAKFNLELGRAARCFPKQREAAQQFIRLHRRHGEMVYNVVNQELAQNSERILEAK
jgi:7-cyano-7-deazaguanine synthase in queuosine biosynthesis